ncbi:uncharacterized protein LOC119678854, partial [Teleopsis dalmanni]|uniref:uncharacterized protein LOC119678854 n=1 Tax=Teleopsis dalmanni TaxID=139649 RepID=UPI0018CEDF2D
MLPFKVLEYLCYLVIFILMCKFSDAASIDFTETSTVATPTATTSAAPTTANTQSSRKPDTMKRAFGECDTGFSWMCLKVEFVKLIERLGEQEELRLLPGVSVVKDTNVTELKTADMMAEVARNYPNDPSSRLNGYIVSKLTNFLQTRMLRFKLIDNKTVAESRSAVETGRKKFGKKGGLEAIIAAGLMMKGTLMAVGMGAIALMAGKALMTALMALTLTSVLGLKALASGGGKSTTYEIVAKPVYTSSHSHSVHEEGHGHGHYGGAHSGSGYGGYSRSINVEMPNE